MSEIIVTHDLAALAGEINTVVRESGIKTGRVETLRQTLTDALEALDQIAGGASE